MNLQMNLFIHMKVHMTVQLKVHIRVHEGWEPSSDVVLEEGELIGGRLAVTSLHWGALGSY